MAWGDKPGKLLLAKLLGAQCVELELKRILLLLAKLLGTKGPICSIDHALGRRNLRQRRYLGGGDAASSKTTDKQCGHKHGANLQVLLHRAFSDYPAEIMRLA
jgi:hypothetical protein